MQQAHHAQRKPPEEGSGQQQPQTLATTENQMPVVGPYKAWCSSRSVGLEVRALLFTWLIRYYAQSGRKQQRFPFHLAIADCPLISRVLSVCGWVKPQSTTRISW